MRIEDLRREKNGTRPRVAAHVIWEDCPRPPHEVYFETDEEFAGSLSCDPHAFLIASLIPALHYGEKRVRVDAEVCPELKHGLITAMTWLRHWYYGPERELVRIEAGTASRLPRRDVPPRAGLFFSGGIDSLSTLRVNRLDFPDQHPGALKDGLLAYGLEMDSPAAYEHVKRSLSELASYAGLTLVPVYTNLYLHYRDEDSRRSFGFWEEKFEGAALAAIAHAFSRRLSSASISSTLDIPNLGPLGAHPVLDPSYSSHDLRIRHEGAALSRLDKTKLLADWDFALKRMRVCNQFARYSEQSLNCGECEKCIRTMLALVALGKLGEATSFSRRDVSAELVMEKVHLTRGRKWLRRSSYQELLMPLARVGRDDLVRAIEHKLSERRAVRWKAKVKDYDRRYLGGVLGWVRERRRVARASH
jgi:hypothetical protein